MKLTELEELRQKSYEISQISLKPADDPIAQFTEAQMEEYNKRHMAELEQYARNCDINEQRALLRGLDPRLICDELRETLEKYYAYQRQIEQLTAITTQGE